MLHIFVDESGDPGFKISSSQYFVMGFAFFPTESYKNSIDKIKNDIRSRSGKAPKEIKFNKSSHEVRIQLLRKLVENNWQFGYIYVNKVKIFEYLREHPEINYIYNQMRIPIYSVYRLEFSKFHTSVALMPANLL